MSTTLGLRRLAAGLAAVATAVLPMAASAAATPTTTSRGMATSAPSAYAPAATSLAPGAANTSATQEKVLNRGGTDPSVSYPYVDPGTGTEQYFSAEQNKVQVTVSKTKDLRSRERVAVSWKGAKPSGNLPENPYGAFGRGTENPVVILQCRGNGSDPRQCWTSSSIQRSGKQTTQSKAIWTKDAGAPAEMRQRLSGLPGAVSQAPTDCQSFLSIPTNWVHLTPFVGWDPDPKNPSHSKTYWACDDTAMPSAAGISATFAAQEQYAQTRADGTGFTQFEVRTDAENVDLGCSDKQPCSIVVIPIMGLTCSDHGGSTALDTPDGQALNNCRAQPSRTGQVTDGSDGTPAVNGQFWWAPSNWNQRFAFPITFGTPPSVCDFDSRTPTIFFGSWLLDQASLQWTPAFCLDRTRFKYQHSRGVDDGGFAQMSTGQGPVASFVSLPHAQIGTDPVGFAPTAITTWSVGFVVDRRNAAGSPGELATMKLTPRLLAKLLTQSYPGSQAIRTTHTGPDGKTDLVGNYPNITLDPEFRRLNPDAPVYQETDSLSVPAATLGTISFPADLTQSMTEYIASDKAAMDFINGVPDGRMRVNSYYRGTQMPTKSIPLQDRFTYNRGTDRLCKDDQIPYFSRIFNPQSSIHENALTLLDAWPVSQDDCRAANANTNSGPGSYRRVDRQGYGHRFMMAIIGNPDGPRYGLRTAHLASAPNQFVAPSNDGMAKAISTAKQATPHAPYTMTVPDIRKANGYPGTQIVMTAAKMRGLAPDSAKKVEQFIKVSLTEGQKPGPGNGQLPEGYLPITAKGPTAKMYASALATATAIGLQKPEVIAPDGSTAPGSGNLGGSAGGAGGPLGAAGALGALAGGAGSGGPDGSTSGAGGTAPGSSTADASKNPVAAAAKPGDVAKKDTRKEATKGSGADQQDPSNPTKGITSWLGKNLLPLLLLLGLLAAAVSAFGAARREDDESEEA